MATYSGTTTYTVDASTGPGTISGTSTYEVTAATGTTVTGTTDYTVADESLMTTVFGTTNFSVATRPAIFVRQGSALTRVQLGIRQGDHIVWLSPPV